MKKLFIILAAFMFVSNILFAQANIFENVGKDYNYSKSANEKIERFKTREVNKQWGTVKLKSTNIFSKNFKGIFNILDKNLEFKITKDFGIDINSVQGYKAELKDDGYAILSVSANNIAASIWYKNDFYSIESIEDGICFVSEIDISEIAKHENPDDYGRTNTTFKLNKTTNQKSFASIQSAATVKVFVAYTPAVLNYYGSESAVNTFINNCWSTTNDVFGRSGISSTVQLGGSWEFNYTESGNSVTDVNNFKNNTDVQTKRNQYEGDVCVLLVHSLNDNTVGQSAGVGVSFDDAYCVVLDNKAIATGYYTFPHELGHLFGARHQIGFDNDNTPHAYVHGKAYSYGRDDWDPRSFRTIMAKTGEGGRLPDGSVYNCYINKRIPYFANPSINDPYSGVPTGTQDTSEVAYQIDDYASTLAAFQPITTIGTISSNQWWAGNITITGNVTINSGVTLTVDPNAQINFNPGCNLIVNGTLSAVGTPSGGITFTRSGTTGTWGGIQFNSGSSGNLNYCIINNVYAYASGAIKINNSSPTIQNCTIENNGSTTNGIYVMNNAAPTLNNNTIRNNTYDAIVFDHAGGYLTNNKITASNGRASINCWDNANPTFSTSGGSTGLNLLQNGAYGIYADWYSTPNAGTSSSQSSYNKLLDATAYNATALGYSTIYAKYNYWSPFPPMNIGADAGCIVYWDPYLTTPPFSIVAPPDFKEKNLLNKTLANINGDDDLLLAEDLKSKKRYDEAINIYKQIIDKDINEYSSSTALVELGHIYRETKKIELFDYIKSFTSGNKTTKGIAIDLVVNISKEEGQIDAAKLLNDELLGGNFKKTRFAMKGNLNLFHIYYAQGNYALAKDVLAELKTAGEWNIGINTAELLMNEIDQKVNSNDKLVKQIETNSINPDFSLEQSYPNPFNPTAKISFSLPQKSQIKLKVFDVLGREIQILADGIYEAGKYEVEFNATNLPSGVYFYNLTTGSNSITKKMLLMK